MPNLASRALPRNNNPPHRFRPVARPIYRDGYFVGNDVCWVSLGQACDRVIRRLTKGGAA